MKMVLKTSFLLVLVLLCVGFVQQASGQGTAPAAGPSAQISEMTFDFGELIEGRDYVHDFKIKNAGSATLEIKKVLPG